MISRHKNHDLARARQRSFAISCAMRSYPPTKRDILDQICTLRMSSFSSARLTFWHRTARFAILFPANLFARTNRIVPGFRLAAILDRRGARLGCFHCLADVPDDQMRLHEDGAAFSGALIKPIVRKRNSASACAAVSGYPERNDPREAAARVRPFRSSEAGSGLSIWEGRVVRMSKVRRGEVQTRHPGSFLNTTCANP